MYHEKVECVICPDCKCTTAIWKTKCNQCGKKLSLKWERHYFTRQYIC